MVEPLPIPPGAQISNDAVPPAAGPPTIPQGAQIADSVPVQDDTNDDWVGHAWEVGQTAYHDVGAAAQGFADLAKHVVGYQISQNAKDELGRGLSALKSGGISEAQMHLRNASTDFVTNHPLSQLLKQQLDSSARNAAAVQEDMKAGDHLAVVQHAAGILPIANLVSDAFDKAIQEPTAENIMHAVVTGTLALSPSILKRIRSAGEAADAAASEESMPRPGIVKQIIKGRSVEQEPAQAALRTAAGTEEASLGDALAKPIADSKATVDAAYQRISDADQAAKAHVERLQSIDEELGQLGDEDPADLQRANELNRERDTVEAKLDESGTDPALAKQAKDAYKKYRSQQTVEQKVFKNPSVISGDVRYGTPETVNVDAAIKALRRMQTTRYGDQVAMAFGKDGAEQLLSKLYEAQRQGVHAMKAQQVAIWVAKIAGAGAAVEAGRILTGAVQ